LVDNLKDAAADAKLKVDA